MRSAKWSGLLVVLVFLALPAPAHAFFGWLDNLSGPGKFRGWQFEFRVACFGETSETKKISERVAIAQGLTERLTSRSQPADLAAAQNAWRDLVTQLRRSALVMPILPDGFEGANINQFLKISFFTTLSMGSDSSRSAPPNEARQTQNVPAADPITESMSQLTAAFNASLAPLIDDFARAETAIASTGVVFSACSIEKRRRSSLEVGVNFWKADATPDYARNNRIQLTTLMPLFSFRVLQDPRWDVADVGFGGGVYWFTSPAFEQFSGVILQPARFDFHAPTLWASYKVSSFRRWAAVPNFRFGYMIFPAGFSPNAFAARGAKAVRIPAELVPTWAVVFNVQPLFSKPSAQLPKK
jgi:hypothetical protein